MVLNLDTIQCLFLVSTYVAALTSETHQLHQIVPVQLDKFVNIVAQEAVIVISFPSLSLQLCMILWQRSIFTTRALKEDPLPTGMFGITY